MARMIPDYVHVDCKSNAERKLFSRFREELGNDYIVLHSLGLARHERKLRSEIDFVVICSKGVLTIEVKGGRVTQQNGQWLFTDRYGVPHRARESPFDQASSAMYSLRRSCGKRFGPHSCQAKCTFGFCVLFADITANWDLVSVDERRSLDRGDLARPMSLTIEDQFEYSSAEIRRVTGGAVEPSGLSAKDMSCLVDFLRGDFDFVPALAHYIDSSHSQLLNLTEEQYQIVDGLGECERVLIRGMAGTGKTVLAARKCRTEALKGRRVLYLCFNRFLAASLRRCFQQDLLLSGAVEVSTLHSYAMGMIEDAGLDSQLVGCPDRELYRDRVPVLFTEAFVRLHDEAPFDVLVVDEGQDLRLAAYADVFDWSLKGGLAGGMWAWFEDGQQDIFLEDVSGAERLDLAAFSPMAFQLTRNCRNTLPISVFTSLVSGAGTLQCLVTSGPRVVHHFYDSRKHQLKLLTNELRQLLGGGVLARDIVVLSSRGCSNSVIGDLIAQKDFDAVPYGTGHRDEQLRFATIQSFKGLESKVIVLTDVEALSWARDRALNYVACSRAMSYLSILMSKKTKAQYSSMAAEFGLRLAGGEAAT